MRFAAPAILDFVAGLALLLLAASLVRVSLRQRTYQLFVLLLVLRAGEIGAFGLMRSADTLAEATFWARISVWNAIPVLAVSLLFVSRYPARRPGLAWRAALPAASLVLTLAFAVAFVADPHAFLPEVRFDAARDAWGRFIGPGLQILNALNLLAQAACVLLLVRSALGAAEASVLRRQALLVAAAFAVPLAHLGGFYAVFAPLAPGALSGVAGLVAASALASLLALALAVRHVRARAPDATREARILTLGVLVPVAAGAFDAGLVYSALQGIVRPFFYENGANLWRVAFAVLVAYAILRYELFDLRDRMRRRLAVVIGGVAALGFLLLVSFVVFRVRGVDPVSLAVAQVLAVGSVVLGFSGLRRFSSEAALRLVPEPGEDDDTFGRKLEVYRAALERCFQSDGTLNQTADLVLRGLRRELGLSDRDHALLVAAVRPAPRGGGGLLVPGARFLGRYRVERPLGAGASGGAFLARDEAVGRAVVLKALHATGDEGGAERLLKEARALGAVHHPNVLTLYDVERVGDEVVLVEEHVPGGNLEDALAKEGALPPARALRLLDDVLAGLAAAHAAGLVHRDLKGANVLLAADGRAKVADFGSAKVPKAEGTTMLGMTEAGFQPGTLVAMAPEQARGGRVDARTDLYAAAALLYRLLTNEHYLDFEGKTDFEAREAILLDEPRFPHARVPEDLEAVLARALAKKPDRRFATAEEMRSALAAVRAATSATSP